MRFLDGLPLPVAVEPAAMAASVTTSPPAAAAEAIVQESPAVSSHPAAPAETPQEPPATPVNSAAAQAVPAVMPLVRAPNEFQSSPLGHLPVVAPVQHNTYSFTFNIGKFNCPILLYWFEWIRLKRNCYPGWW